MRLRLISPRSHNTVCSPICRSSTIFVLIISIFLLITIHLSNPTQAFFHSERNIWTHSASNFQATFVVDLYLPSSTFFSTTNGEGFDVPICKRANPNEDPLAFTLKTRTYDPTTNILTISFTTEFSGQSVNCFPTSPFQVPYVGYSTVDGSGSRHYAMGLFGAGQVALTPRITTINDITTYEAEVYFIDLHFMRDIRLVQMVRFTLIVSMDRINNIKLMKDDGTFITQDHGCSAAQSPAGTHQTVITCIKAFPQYTKTLIVTVQSDSNVKTTSVGTRVDIIDPSTNESYGYSRASSSGSGFPLDGQISSIELSTTPQIPLPPTMLGKNNIQSIEYIAKYMYYSSSGSLFRPDLSYTNYQPRFQYVIPTCSSPNGSINFNPASNWVGPVPLGSLSKTNGFDVGLLYCDLIYTPFFPNINQYLITDENANPSMFNTERASIIPWPIYPIFSSNQIPPPHQLRTFEPPLPTLNSLISNRATKYFHVETQTCHYGVIINTVINGGTTTKTTSIHNRLFIAINGGFKPESKLTIKLSLPKISTSTLSLTSTTILSKTLSTAVKLRQATYTRDVISTLTSVMTSIDTTTNNDYDIMNWDFVIEDYAHPEFVIDIIIPIHTTTTSTVDSNNNSIDVQPNGDIYISQVDENGNVIKSISPLSIPIELVYYNGTSLTHFPFAEPKPILRTQQLSFQPSFEFLPNLQCLPSQDIFIIPSPQQITPFISNITISLSPKLYNQQLNNDSSSLDDNSFLTQLSSSLITTTIYPNSIIGIDYSTSSPNVILDNTNPFYTINDDSEEEDSLWTYSHDVDNQIITITYIGTTPITIQSNAPQSLPLFKLQFITQNRDDVIAIKRTISLQSTIQSKPSYYDGVIEIVQQYGNYNGGTLIINNIDHDDDMKQLYLLSDKPTQTISTTINAIVGTSQFNITLSNPRQIVYGITTISLINADDDDTTILYEFDEQFITTSTTTLLESKTIPITIPPTIILPNVISNVFFKFTFTPNDSTQESISTFNTQQFQLFSQCYHKDLSTSSSSITPTDSCGANGTCLVNGQCQCNENYIGDKCETFVSKCDGYCIADNTQDCNEDVMGGKSPCLCNQGYIGDKCETISKCYNYCIVDNIQDCNENATGDESPCLCNDGYIGDKCETFFVSKCDGYCQNGNYDSCDESIEINNNIDSSTTITPCRCKSGWTGLKCDVESQQRNNPNSTFNIFHHQLNMIVFISIILFIFSL